MYRTLLAHVPYHTVRIDLVANPISTASWTALITSVPYGCTAMQVGYTGSGILQVSNGDLGDEAAHVMPIQIMPGGSDELIPFELARLKRFSAKAVDKNVTSGELVINFYG